MTGRCSLLDLGRELSFDLSFNRAYFKCSKPLINKPSSPVWQRGRGSGCVGRPRGGAPRRRRRRPLVAPRHSRRAGAAPLPHSLLPYFTRPARDGRGSNFAVRIIFAQETQGKDRCALYLVSSVWRRLSTLLHRSRAARKPTPRRRGPWTRRRRRRRRRGERQGAARSSPTTSTVWASVCARWSTSRPVLLGCVLPWHIPARRLDSGTLSGTRGHACILSTPA